MMKKSFDRVTRVTAAVEGLILTEGGEKKMKSGHSIILRSPMYG